MAATYIPIASTTLTTSAATVIFSDIPQTYTDLLIRFSARAAGTVNNSFWVRLNGNTSTNYGTTHLRGDGSSAISQRNTSGTFFNHRNGMNSDANTSNTFTNGEIYIPNYTASTNKQLGIFTALENNGTTAYVSASAGVYLQTSAITSITMYASDDNLVAGTTFHLYGISATS